MAYHTTNYNYQRGFAYVWSLMLIAFLGVSLTLAAALYSTAARRDRERELLFIGHEFRQALERYVKANGTGQYPLTLDELLQDPRFAGTRRHLRRCYLDPLTGKRDWILIRRQGRIVGIHSSAMQRPLKQDQFDDDDAGLAHKARYTDWLFTYPHDLYLYLLTPSAGAEH